MADLLDMLATERGTDVPDADLGLTSQIRRALFRGESLTVAGARERFGGSHGLMSQAISVMERLGYRFERTPNADGTLTYRLVNPEHTPTEQQLTALRTRYPSRYSSRRPAGAVAVPPRQRQRRRDDEDTATPDRTDGTLPVLPGLGEPVTVYALALNDDGSITLGLRNGSRRWVTTVTGITE